MDVLYLIICGIAIWYYFKVIRPKKTHKWQETQRDTNLNTIRPVEIDFLTERALKTTQHIVAGYLAICQANKVKISPLTIHMAEKFEGAQSMEITSSFTLFDVFTNPFYDLQMRMLIAGGGSHQPKSFTMTPDMLFAKNEQNHETAFQEKSEQIKKIVCEKIYQELFGYEKGNSLFDINEYDLEMSHYPFGNVTLTGGWGYLDPQNSLKNFYFIAQQLETQFSNATIIFDGTVITVKF